MADGRAIISLFSPEDPTGTSSFTTTIERPLFLFGETMKGRVQPSSDSGRATDPPQPQGVRVNEMTACICLVCRFAEMYSSYQDMSLLRKWNCGIGGCTARMTLGVYSKIREHMRQHFGKSGHYRCFETHCPKSNKEFPRWGELVRYTKGIHCTKSNEFFCSALGCERRYRGFTRKDKLTDHVRKVHEGKVRPGKAMRRIKPATKASDGSGYKA